MSQTFVHQFTVSLDGFGTGEGQTREEPFGHAGERLHQWMFDTHWWKSRGSVSAGGVDDAFLQRHDQGVGAEIMGANKWGFKGWHEDPEWKGWWGPNPPFHTPVFVLTHHPRSSIEMEGGTTYHFLDASPAEALEAAGEAAGDEAAAGLRWLADTQLPDGSWDEPQFTGTGFPADFSINYGLYRQVFPLMALGRCLR